jgi:hypothetical protein
VVCDLFLKPSSLISINGFINTYKLAEHLGNLGFTTVILCSGQTELFEDSTQRNFFLAALPKSIWTKSDLTAKVNNN